MPNHSLNDSHMPSQAIYIDSNDALVSISDAEKIFYLNTPIIADAGIRILVGLNNLTIPNTIYNFNSSNNSIIFTQGTTETISVSVGNYSATTLKDALNTAITAAGLDITSSFDEDNAVFSFTGGSAFTIDSATMSRQLGLKEQLPTSSSTSYTATRVCDFAGATNLYVRIRNLSMNNLDSRGNTSSIIASIVVNTNYGEYIFFSSPDILYFMISENKISHLDVEITDQEGNVVDLNGSSFNLTLSVHFVKHREVNIDTNRILGEIQNREIEAEKEAQNQTQEKPKQDTK